MVLEAQAESEAVRVRGEAEAYAIEAKARAEAEQMAKKADAWKEYQDAAIVDMILESMPQVSVSDNWQRIGSGHQSHDQPDA